MSDLGEQILAGRLGMLLVNRLRIHDMHQRHPDIARQRHPDTARQRPADMARQRPDDDEAPLFIIGLPRTGTTALSNLLAADPQIRSLRLWESGAPVPPPESATQDDDPRIAETAAGLEAMYAAFPKMRSMYFQTPTGPTECQDLLGMAFRTAQFDGMARVPSYLEWVLGCDMIPAYEMHRRTLQLLQWHCPPRRWHLKTPVHMLSLDALTAVYPDARFLWTHRDPAAVLGSVCSLIAYTRSWVSDGGDDAELGAGQVALWAEAVRRAMDFRARVGEARFADVDFGALNSEPLSTVTAAYGRLGLELGPAGRASVQRWAAAHPAGAQGVHEYALDDFGLHPDGVRAHFGPYLERFAVPT